MKRIVVFAAVFVALLCLVTVSSSERYVYETFDGEQIVYDTNSYWPIIIKPGRGPVNESGEHMAYTADVPKAGNDIAQDLTAMNGNFAYLKADLLALGIFIKMTLLTSTTSATFTTQATTTRALVKGVAGGGGGGGVPNAAAGQFIAAGGGASGSSFEKLFTVTGSTGYSYQCGAAGAGGAGQAAGTGSTGGDTTFTVGGTTVTGKGGLGGASTMSSGTYPDVTFGGRALQSTGGDENGSGTSGGYGVRLTGDKGFGGLGGSSYFGGGSYPSGIVVGNGSPGTAYGAGGAGGVSMDASGAATGGAGVQGCIIVYEFR